MTEYLIRTDRKEKQTYIVKLGDSNKMIGLIYTDFVLYSGCRSIFIEDIVDSGSNEKIAEIKLYDNGNIFSVYLEEKKFSSIDLAEVYKDETDVISYEKHDKAQLLEKQGCLGLEDMGISHAYFFEGDMTQVFCFEKSGDVAGIVTMKYEGTDSDRVMLKALPLIMAERIRKQDYLFRFLKD
ncbi:MAG: hypothetical protein U9P44_00975 [archaeon]|nr:hypothetical protein [archaeon]